MNAHRARVPVEREITRAMREEHARNQVGALEVAYRYLLRARGGLRRGVRGMFRPLTYDDALAALRDRIAKYGGET